MLNPLQHSSAITILTDEFRGLVTACSLEVPEQKGRSKDNIPVKICQDILEEMFIYIYIYIPVYLSPFPVYTELIFHSDFCRIESKMEIQENSSWFMF